MAVVAVLVVLCSLSIISQAAINQFLATIPGNWEYAVGGIIILLVSLRLLIAGIGATGVSSLILKSSDAGKFCGQNAIEDIFVKLHRKFTVFTNVNAIPSLMMKYQRAH